MNCPNKYIKRRALVILSFLLLLTLPFLYFKIQKDSPEILGLDTEMENVEISISPDLNFSLFTPYAVSVTNIPPTPSNVSLNLSVDMGDENTCWDFKVDGTCASEPISTNMIYDEQSNSYQKNIYPDQIYPEIFFALSSITWGNAPLNTPIRRNDYQIFHFINNFDMVSDMNIWIEFNTAPVSDVNSADLQVYIVEKGHDITYFNSDWTLNAGVELAGSKTKTSQYDHTHSANSSHHLIRLSTDANGKVGNKALDISDDFWIVLYSNSPNTSRGWNLRYQPSSLCTNSAHWYRGNITGWTTTFQQGCPDAHIHMSRRNIDYRDSVKAYVSATYESGTFSSPITTFDFTPLPNLAPNGTSFLNPIMGSTYKGSLNIQWNPATDPNPTDTLTYSIYLTQTGQQPTTLVSNTSNTTYTLDTTQQTDGEYTLTGEVCDNLSLCTTFNMDGVFYIDNIVTPETISSITIESTNSNPSFAKNGDTVTLTFTASGVISQPTVNIYSAGESVTEIISITNTEGNTWEASYDVSYTDTEGGISFEILSDNLDKIYYSTTDQSNIYVDITVPTSPISSVESGTYTDSKSMSLTSSSDAYIKYVIDQESVTCSTGTLYESSILISEDKSIKAIACDLAGNSSSISSYEYVIVYSIDSLSISSSNSNSQYAKALDVISLSFTTTDEISTPTIILSIGDTILTGDISLTTQDNINWVATYTVGQNDPNGLLSFSLSSSNLYTTFTETTDLSRVTIDILAPSIPLSNIPSGTYTSTKTVTLTSLNSSLIKYTLDGTTPTCTTGTTYLLPITISSSKVIKSVSCDLAGNKSALATISISIFPDTYVIDDSQQEESDDTTVENIIEETENIEEKEVGKIIPKLKVRILDGNSNPLSNIFVTIYSKPQTTKTDINGIAIFKNIPIGKHTLEYTYEDNTYTQNITVDDEYIKEDGTTEIIDILMEKKESINIYLIGGGILTFILLVFVIVRGIVRGNKEIDKESISV